MDRLSLTVSDLESSSAAMGFFACLHSPIKIIRAIRDAYA